MNSLARKIGVANPHQFALHFDALTGMNTQSSGKWRSSFNGEKALSTQQLQLLSRIDPEVFERHEMGPANLWQAMWAPLFSYSTNYAYTSDLKFEAQPDELPRFFTASWK